MSTPVKNKLIIKENKEIAQDTHHLVFDGEIPLFIPGQFCMLTCEKNSKKRAYSIASAPGKALELCIKGVGEASNCFINLEVGKEMEVHLPMGHFTLPETGDLVMLASGTGLVPYRSMLRTLFKQHFSGEGEDTERTIILIHSVKSKTDLLYEEEFKELAENHKNFTYLPTLTREEVDGYKQGRVQQHLQEQIKENTHYLICGLNRMVEDVEKLLIEKGIAKEQIHYEKYG